MSKLRKNLDAYGKDLMASNQIMSSAIKDLQAALKSMHGLGMNMRRLAATPFGEDPEDFKYLYQEVVEKLTFVQRMLQSYRYVERFYNLGDEYDVAGTLGVADGFNDQQDMERYWGTDYNTSKSFRAASSKKTARQSKLRHILAQEGFGKTALNIDPRKVDAINEMTDWNDHNGAAIALLEVLGMKKEVKVMGHVQKIHEIVGSMPYELGQFRSAMMKQAYKAAKRVKMPNGETLYDQLD